MYMCVIELIARRRKVSHALARWGESSSSLWERKLGWWVSRRLSSLKNDAVCAKVDEETLMETQEVDEEKGAIHLW